MEADEFYKSVGNVRCPALGGECVHFTSEGFNHLVYKTGKKEPRHQLVQVMKFELLGKAKLLLEQTSTFQEYEEEFRFVPVNRGGAYRKENMLVRAWGFVAIINKFRLKVVVMRLISWNVNGLRSVIRRDFEAWLAEANYDVVCLQEVKFKEDLLSTHWFENYVAFWNSSRRSGVSGVATLVHENFAVTNIRKGIGHPALDEEGRVLITDVAGLRVVNIYAPHSHRKLIRLDAKIAFLAGLKGFIEELRSDGVPLVLVGDFNIAHQEIDLANPKANQRNAGFLPVEREWVTELLASSFVDAFRPFEPRGEYYTWWSMRKGVRERNVGWRLDYVFVEDQLIPSLVACHHLPERTGSDHCPVVFELQLRGAGKLNRTIPAKIGK